MAGTLSIAEERKFDRPLDCGAMKIRTTSDFVAAASNPAILETLIVSPIV